MSSGGVGKSVGWEERGHLWKHYIINVPNNNEQQMWVMCRTHSEGSTRQNVVARSNQLRRSEVSASTPGGRAKCREGVRCTDATKN